MKMITLFCSAALFMPRPVLADPPKPTGATEPKPQVRPAVRDLLTQSPGYHPLRPAEQQKACEAAKKGSRQGPRAELADCAEPPATTDSTAKKIFPPLKGQSGVDYVKPQTRRMVSPGSDKESAEAPSTAPEVSPPKE